ncbi:hypothetical protein [Microbacterium laevaniformans]|uniref:hypothetical protein n=1 Tax=Microbacterium laevaniformans TaxID=36807 RepID=UPI003D9744FC
MPTYDWPLIQQRSGNSIESLIATLLRRQYPAARQVNPSQGDGGIDILLMTEAGLEVWQVKGFTTALTNSQFRQVKSSWERFVAEHVTSGEQRVARYHLVTPWTPTEERIQEFDELTTEATFPRQWDGEAFVAGLADRFPETMQRFVYGEGVLEQFINKKAMIAGSPVERGEALTILEAIETRQDALDALRDLVDDNYRIEHGTRFATDDRELPLPREDDPAVLHRMTYLGDSRWRQTSVVPRTPDALDINPITFNFEFLATPGTPEHDAVVAWSEWGIPFTDARVRAQTVGGPFADEEPVESTLSFVEVERSDGPSLYLRSVTSSGHSRFRLALRIVAHTVGQDTGWVRLVLETPEHALSFEMRMKPEGEADVTATMGDVDGRNPESVRDEIDTLFSIGADDTISIETGSGQPLVRATSAMLPTAMEAIQRPVADCLVQLQEYAASDFVMPAVAELTDGQFCYLSLLASIYGGTAHHWSWTEVTFQVPEEPAKAEQIVTMAIEAQAGGHTLVKVEAPSFVLGNRTYSLDHPLASTAHSIALETGIEPSSLQSGDTFRLVPGPDDQATTAKIVDWTPGSIQFD